MPSRIEDYALIGDCQSAALVGRDGSIDWLCFPRFDSPACFAALLGTPEHGRWLLAPAEPAARVSRRYRPGTLILETDFETTTGAVRVIDFMPPRTGTPDVMRLVQGLHGSVPMVMDLAVRFDYGSVVPWVRRTERGIKASAGPETLHLRTPAHLQGVGLRTEAAFTVEAGQQIPFELAWSQTHDPDPEPREVQHCLDETARWWADWSDRCTFQGEWQEPVRRSLITLKALTYAPTGGIVAAATTSLPERIGGVRNWDYRYCWLRDATFALYALMAGALSYRASSTRTSTSSRPAST
jgi:GH15 family glucan-1,4-alpha-glucosidase